MAFNVDFGSLLGGIGGLFSGGLNYLSQQATNRQNMMMNSGAWKAQQVQAEASALGVSPLAVLGNTGSSLPMQPVTQDFSGSGQMLGRAFSAQAAKSDVVDRLQTQGLVLQNAKLENEVAAGQLRNSMTAASMTQPGTARVTSGDVFPPPYARGLGTRENPSPMYEWYFDPDNPSYPPVKVISDKYAHTQFGPTAYYTGLAAMPGMISGWANDLNAYSNAQGRLLRGDVLRNMQSAPPITDYWSTYGGQ